MFLKKLVRNSALTISYDHQGAILVRQGRIYSLNLQEQILGLKDDTQTIHQIRLSGIRAIEEVQGMNSLP
ncbi:hypothetical protein WQ57_08595 [Mesobacillus campisalis]|uniref:Uncharacterized protein n=1 Tax=Mesobacillus campisalis TaxID=1408103 RepID=A0A0M2SWU1_9BACI|nr:hypothetical protein [Mesobacillus campisalis]KKK38638.1 hypothetical protein WQ57_08595 [Mesobacillus campisalis]